MDFLSDETISKIVLGGFVILVIFLILRGIKILFKVVLFVLLVAVGAMIYMHFRT